MGKSSNTVHSRSRNDSMPPPQQILPVSGPLCSFCRAAEVYNESVDLKHSQLGVQIGSRVHPPFYTNLPGRYDLPKVQINTSRFHIFYYPSSVYGKSRNLAFKLIWRIYNFSTPILQASGIRSVIQGTRYATINLLKRCIYSSALYSSFYLYLLSGQRKGCTRTLLGRTLDICEELDIDFTRYMLHAPYARGVNLGMNCFIPHGVNGTVSQIYVQ